MEKGETGMSKRKKQFVKTAKCLSKRKKSDNCTIFRGIRTGKFVHCPL